MIKDIIVLFFVINGLFWGLANHSQHCNLASVFGVVKCPPHYIHLLMGLISFYPIDRSAIKNMPEKTKPNNTKYLDYVISKQINIVDCPVSYKQFLKYEEVWKEAKIKSMKKNMFGEDEENENFDYHIRTRQACNIIYENDDFRKIKPTKENKLVIDEMKNKEYELLKDAGILKYNSGLQIISPKFNNILSNIQKFIFDDRRL